MPVALCLKEHLLETVEMTMGFVASPAFTRVFSGRSARLLIFKMKLTGSCEHLEGCFMQHLRSFTKHLS